MRNFRATDSLFVVVDAVREINVRVRFGVVLMLQLFRTKVIVKLANASPCNYIRSLYKRKALSAPSVSQRFFVVYKLLYRRYDLFELNIVDTDVYTLHTSIRTNTFCGPRKKFPFFFCLGSFAGHQQQWNTKLVNTFCVLGHFCQIFHTQFLLSRLKSIFSFFFASNYTK